MWLMILLILITSKAHKVLLRFETFFIKPFFLYSVFLSVFGRHVFNNKEFACEWDNDILKIKLFGFKCNIILQVIIFFIIWEYNISSLWRSKLKASILSEAYYTWGFPLRSDKTRNGITPSQLGYGLEVIIPL